VKSVRDSSTEGPPSCAANCESTDCQNASGSSRLSPGSSAGGKAGSIIVELRPEWKKGEVARWCDITPGGTRVVGAGARWAEKGRERSGALACEMRCGKDRPGGRIDVVGATGAIVETGRSVGRAERASSWGGPGWRGGEVEVEVEATGPVVAAGPSAAREAIRSCLARTLAPRWKTLTGAAEGGAGHSHRHAPEMQRWHAPPWSFECVSSHFLRRCRPARWTAGQRTSEAGARGRAESGGEGGSAQVRQPALERLLPVLVDPSSDAMLVVELAELERRWRRSESRSTLARGDETGGVEQLSRQLSGGLARTVACALVD